jgi:hypothetical protein
MVSAESSKRSAKKPRPTDYSIYPFLSTAGLSLNVRTLKARLALRLVNKEEQRDEKR